MTADYTARADIVALQGQMQVVTRFLSEQFPDKWGTTPADGLGLCPTCGENNWHNCWRCKTCDPVPEIDRPAVTDAEVQAMAEYLWPLYREHAPSIADLRAALEAAAARQEKP